MDFKTEIIQYCRKSLSDKVSGLKEKLNELVLDAQNDSKSSAGDKHETARAMMQLEQEKILTQLGEAGRQLDNLSAINFSESPQTVLPGALIETDKGTILLAVAMGKVNVMGKDVMVISPQAPLAKAMMNARENDLLVFSATDYKIRKIS